FVYRRVPTSFVPDEDQGYFMVLLQAPEGASLGYTSTLADKVSEVLAKEPDVIGVFSVPGFSFSGVAPNRGFVFVNLKDVGERTAAGHSAQEIINRMRGKLLGITEGLAVPFLPPAIQGLGAY